MSAPIIAREAAEEMLIAWLSDIGATVNDAGREKVLSAVMAGRLDWSGSAFAYRLIAPVKVESGPPIDHIDLGEPTGADLIDAAKGSRSDIDTAMRLLSSVSHQPLAVFQRMKQRDLSLLVELVAFFA